VGRRTGRSNGVASKQLTIGRRRRLLGGRKADDRGRRAEDGGRKGRAFSVFRVFRGLTAGSRGGETTKDTKHTKESADDGGRRAEDGGERTTKKPRREGGRRRAAGSSWLLCVFVVQRSEVSQIPNRRSSIPNPQSMEMQNEEGRMKKDPSAPSSVLCRLSSPAPRSQLPIAAGLIRVVLCVNTRLCCYEIQ